MIKSNFRRKQLLTKNFWKYNKHNIWHDSVGKYFNRFIKCPITKHSNIVEIACDGELPRSHCFDCERDID